MGKLSSVNLADFVEAYTKLATNQMVADEFGVSVPSVRRLKKMAEEKYNIVLVKSTMVDAGDAETEPRITPDIDMLEVDAGVKLINLERKMAIARRQIRTLKKAVSEKMSVDELAIKAIPMINKSPPPKATKSGQSVRKIDHGTPVLMLSDLHIGELVTASSVGGSNEYNVSVFRRRLKSVISKVVGYCTTALAPSDHKEIVVALNGDIVSGVIHDELVENADVPVLESVLVAVDAISEALITLAYTFDKVSVKVTVGNHGRLTPTKSYKGAVQNNYDWMVGKILKGRLRNHDSINFEIAESNDLIYDVNGITILQTHGDHGCGGGQGDAYYSGVERAFKKRYDREKSRGVEVDHMIIGHFHKYVVTDNTTTNGSLIGESEYSYLHAFGGSGPSQSLFFCHSKYGIIYRVALSVK